MDMNFVARFAVTSAMLSDSSRISSFLKKENKNWCQDLLCYFGRVVDFIQKLCSHCCDVFVLYAFVCSDLSFSIAVTSAMCVCVCVCVLVCCERVCMYYTYTYTYI